MQFAMGNYGTLTGEDIIYLSEINFTDWVAGLEALREKNITVWQYMESFQVKISHDLLLFTYYKTYRNYNVIYCH